MVAMAVLKQPHPLAYRLSRVEVRAFMHCQSSAGALAPAKAEGGIRVG